MLSSPHNPTIKHLVRMRDNRSRRRAGRLLVDGWRETEKALEAGLKPLGVYVTEQDSTDSIGSETGSPEGQPRGDAHRRDTLQRALSIASDLIIPVSDRVMQKISYGQSPRGVVAEFESPDWGLSQLPTPEAGLILVLDCFEKPGNIGAAFRCADAAGADAVMLTPASSDRFNPNAIRSSLGTVFSIPSAAASESEARGWLAEQGYRVFAARVESSDSMWNLDFTGPTALVIGSEADGLGDRWQSGPDGDVAGAHIPMGGKVDSLNASVSAALLLYEASRQRAATGAN